MERTLALLALLGLVMLPGNLTAADTPQDNVFKRAGRQIAEDAKQGTREAKRDLKKTGKDIKSGTSKTAKKLKRDVQQSAKKTSKSAKDTFGK